MYTGTFTKSCQCSGKMIYQTGRYTVGPNFIHLAHRGGFTETWFILEFRGGNQMVVKDNITQNVWVLTRVGP